MGVSKIFVNEKTQYLGFVNTNTDSKGRQPNANDVQEVFEQFKPKNIKKTRAIHPLFARGLSKTLELKINENDGFVILDPEGGSVVAATFRKITGAFAVKKQLFVFIRKAGIGKFNCHVLKFQGPKTAESVASMLARVSQSERSRSRSFDGVLDGNTGKEFRKRLSTMPANRSRSSDALLDEPQRGMVPLSPHTPTRRPTDDAVVSPTTSESTVGMWSPDSGVGDSPNATRAVDMLEETAKTIEQQHWFHGIIPRKVAEGKLSGQPAGTYMVRVAQSRYGYSLSVVTNNGRVEHFRIEQDRNEQYFILGNEYAKFESLTLLLAHYGQKRLTKNNDFCTQPLDKEEHSESEGEEV